MALLDSLGSYNGSSRVSQWANRFLLVSLCLFALSIPHSIAAAHISLNLGLLSWIVRDLSGRKLKFTRTRFDVPLICFVSLTILSTIFSEEPRLSARKLLSTLLFGVIYLLASNLSQRGVRAVFLILLISSLAGAGYSLVEKIRGRGMIVTRIDPAGPLAKSELRAGDVIWMIARKRVRNPEDVEQEIRRHTPGELVELEAIHDGDPVPVRIRVTDSMQNLQNPLGIEAGGPSRRFRASGFSRHFLTFAEQMQIMALAVFGFLIAAPSGHRRRLVFAICGSLLSVALILTASRAVLASFLIALVATSVLSRSSRVVLSTIGMVIVLGAISMTVLLSTRNVDVAQLVDDSSSRRVAYMRAGLRLIPRHPLLGVGMDSHKVHWNEWGFPGDYITHTHSTPIQVALDRGLPALLTLVWLFATIAVWLWRICRKARVAKDNFGAGLALGCLGALLGFAASSLVNYNFGDSEVLLLLLGLIGLSVAWFGGETPRDTNRARVPGESSTTDGRSQGRP